MIILSKAIKANLRLGPVLDTVDRSADRMTFQYCSMVLPNLSFFFFFIIHLMFTPPYGSFFIVTQKPARVGRANVTIK